MRRKMVPPARFQRAIFRLGGGRSHRKGSRVLGGRKVAGVRALGTAKGQLNILRQYFGSC